MPLWERSTVALQELRQRVHASGLLRPTWWGTLRTLAEPLAWYGAAAYAAIPWYVPSLLLGIAQVRSGLVMHAACHNALAPTWSLNKAIAAVYITGYTP